MMTSSLILLTRIIKVFWSIDSLIYFDFSPNDFHRVKFTATGPLQHYLNHIYSSFHDTFGSNRKTMNIIIIADTIFHNLVIIISPSILFIVQLTTTFYLFSDYLGRRENVSHIFEL
jgi:hypothetical protein